MAMSAFPLILERACRDRAVTSQQMKTFRESWAGVTSIWVIDPVILAVSNNRRQRPIMFMREAFPAMAFAQPRNNRRAVTVTPSFMHIPFADTLGEYMGCDVLRFGSLPTADFIEEARRPPPLYFESSDPGFAGKCCICYKGGCLGRCPNPSCGLLVHEGCMRMDN